MKYFIFLALSSTLACSAADFNTGQAARMVIGQATFTAQAFATPSAAQLGAAGGVAFANNTLFVVDGNRTQATPVQNRVLIYHNIDSFVIAPTAEIPQGTRCPVCGGSSNIKAADVVVGQPDFTTITTGLTSSRFRTPTAVASDGVIMAVADTDNNRVLIWKSIPQTNGTPADIELGQADFTTVRAPGVVDNKSFRGPQGVWIQGTRLFVADTQNHRVMVWNNIPTSNNQPADYVLGQPNFTTAPEQNLVNANSAATSTNLLNPVSVTSDGTRLFVTDLGHNRVLIWNTIPAQTDQAADVVVGQPDFASGTANNSAAFCASNGADTSGNKTYPARCGPTLSFPRFALSDGQRLYVADAGNDRVLVFKSIPTANGQKPDEYLGQSDEFTDRVTDSTDTFRPDANITRSSADTLRTPSALAWDGANLFVTDPYDLRVLVFTPGDAALATNSVTNAASRAVFAIGTVVLSGTITAGNTVTVTVNGTKYTYTIVKTDTLPTIVNSLVGLINAKPGDPNVFAIANPAFNEVVLSAKAADVAGNAVTLAASVSSSATIVATASSSSLSGGNVAAEVAPGTLVSISGTGLSDTTAVGQPDANNAYPTLLGGVEVYMDGIKVPLLYVSPTQINTQIPFEVQDTSALSGYVVTRHADGFTTYTTSVNIPIVLESPGIFAYEGTDPRPAIAFHTTGFASAVVDVGGTIKAGDTGTITIAGKAYVYTVTSADTLTSVLTNLINLINADSTAPVRAAAAGQYNRIILAAKVSGSAGNAITVTATNSTGAQLVLTALNAATCCASAAGALVDAAHPAVPGEIISIYATGVGLVQPASASAAAITGTLYSGPAQNSPSQPVDNAQVGGSTANVLNAGLVPGLLGVYEVQLQLSSSLVTNPLTQLFIAQNVFTSNIVTIPVQAP